MIPKCVIRKISPKILNIIFVGQALHSNIGRFLVINLKVSEIAKNTIIEARYATYFENISPLRIVVYPTPTSFRLIPNYFSKSIPIHAEEPRRNKRDRSEKTL